MADLPKVQGMTSPFSALTATLALANMRESSERVDALRYEYEQRLREAVEERNAMIRDARLASIPYARIQKETGLSRERIRQICNKGSEE